MEKEKVRRNEGGKKRRKKEKKRRGVGCKEREDKR